MKIEIDISHQKEVNKGESESFTVQLIASSTTYVGGLIVTPTQERQKIPI